VLPLNEKDIWWAITPLRLIAWLAEENASRSGGAETLRRQSVVDAAIRAINADSLERFLQVLGPIPSVNDSGREFRGLARIREWASRETFGVGGHLYVEEVSGDGPIVVRGRFESKSYAGPTLMTFKLSGEKVARLEIR